MVGEISIGEDGAGHRESFPYAGLASMLGCSVWLSAIVAWCWSSCWKAGSGSMIMSECTLLGVGRCPLACSGTPSLDSACNAPSPSLVTSFTLGGYTDGCVSTAGSSCRLSTVLFLRTGPFVCSCGIESKESLCCSSCDRLSPFVGGTVELAGGTKLAFRLFRAAGAGFTANSWAPGVGGGRKDDEGDGNGDDDASPSRDIDSLDAVEYTFSIRLQCKGFLWRQ